MSSGNNRPKQVIFTASCTSPKAPRPVLEWTENGRPIVMSIPAPGGRDGPAPIMLEDGEWAAYVDPAEDAQAWRLAAAEVSLAPAGTDISTPAKFKTEQAKAAGALLDRAKRAGASADEAWSVVATLQAEVTRLNAEREDGWPRSHHTGRRVMLGKVVQFLRLSGRVGTAEDLWDEFGVEGPAKPTAPLTPLLREDLDFVRALAKEQAEHSGYGPVAVAAHALTAAVQKTGGPR